MNNLASEYRRLARCGRAVPLALLAMGYLFLSGHSCDAAGQPKLMSRFRRLSRTKAVSEKVLEDGTIVESAEIDYRTLRPHGARRMFDRAGQPTAVEWYFLGKRVSEEEFKKRSKQPRADASEKTFSGREVEAALRTQMFAVLLAIRWHDRDLEGYKRVLDSWEQEYPRWLPIRLAKYGWLAFVKSDDPTAAKLAASIKEQLDKEAFRDAQYRPLLVGVVEWARQNSEGTLPASLARNPRGGGRPDRFAQHVPFPFAQAIGFYCLAKGYRLQLTALRRSLGQGGSDRE